MSSCDRSTHLQSTKRMTVPGLCMHTACLILAVAALLQCRAQQCTAFHSALLALGCTSVVHHSRLHTWWIHDAVQVVDILMCVVVVVLGGMRYHLHPIFVSCVLYASTIIVGAWIGAMPDVAVRCTMHASAHVVLCFTLVVLEGI